MALWQLLVLATATTTLVLAENYGYGPPSYAASYAPHSKVYEDYPSYDRDYSFNYGVKDDYTYNYQTRDEVKKGNTVYGSYSIVEPDGKLRVVKYEADDYGFRATVDREGAAPSYGAGLAPASYQAPAYKAAPPPYVAAAPPYAAYKASPAYDAAPYHPGPYKAPARAHVYNQPKLLAPVIYKAPAPLYKGPATYHHDPITAYVKAPIYANHRAPLYKASAVQAYKGVGPTYARGKYKAPAYNYDDEY